MYGDTETEVSSDFVPGYKQELYRGLSLLGTFSTSFAQQGVMASTTLLYSYGLTNGGPAVMLYVWIIGSVFSIIVGCCLAEICSKFPYAGSVYNWSGRLADKDNAAAWSYTTGWLNLLGNATSSVGYNFGFGQFVAALYDIDHPNAPLSLGYQVFIAMLGTILMCFINVLRIDQQGWLNKATMFFSIASLIIICVILMVTKTDTPRQSLHWAFTTTYNASGFKNFGYVCLTAVLTSLFGVAGYEASAHLAEETKDPRVAAPWGMVFNIVTTCVVGFIYLLILILNTTNITDVLGTNYANPAIGVLVSTLGVPKAKALTVLIVIMAFMAGLTNMTVTARVGWAMARDGVFPNSPWLSKVFAMTKTPVNVIKALAIFDFILLLIPLGSSLAFAAITSISTIGFQYSYLIPIFQRLLQTEFVQDKHFNLGSFSYILHFISAIFLFATTGLCFLPQTSPIDIGNFNWAIAVTPAYALAAIFYWFAYARYTFVGPAGERTLPPPSYDNKADRKYVEVKTVSIEPISEELVNIGQAEDGLTI